MRNRHLEYAKAGLRNMRRHEQNPEKRKDIDSLIDDIDRGIYTYEQAIHAAKMIGYRNPSFDDDYIGYPDDDFDK